MKLYGYWRSSASYRVRIALNLKRLNFEYVPVSLLPGISEQKSDSYRAKNPQMLVPFLEDGPVAIGQSMAILEYLDEHYPERPLLPVAEPLRSKVRTFCNIIACDVHPLQNLRVMKMISDNYDADPATWASRWISEGFNALETLANDGPFVFGDTVTLADTLLIPQMYNARRLNVVLDDFPKLVAIDAHCMQLNAFEKAAPENQPDAVQS